MELTGAQQTRLSEVLLGAFPREELLRRMVRSRLNRNLDDFTDGPLRERVSQLIQEAERAGWTHELIHGALEDTPGNPRLKAFVQEYAFSIQREAPGPKLEKIVVDTRTLLDPVGWRERLEVIERQVCRVELWGMARGTGFLVAPDVVLTNHHVVQEVLKGTVSPDFLVLRFDYKRLQDGTELQGRVYGLARDWLLHASPHSSVDLMSPKPYEASIQELDYALLRVKGQPGHELVDGQRTRRWLEVPAEAYAFPPGSPILIVQHPQGDRLRLAIATEGVIAVNSTRTRVTYRTNTLGGSSGAPCFNQDWTLVALHHSGDPGIQAQAQYNEGIPLSTIRAHLPEAVRQQLGWS
jgi:hypothetical protein